MSCSVGLKDIEDFTNELNEPVGKTNINLTVKRKQKSKPNNNKEENTENEKEFDKGNHLCLI